MNEALRPQRLVTAASRSSPRRGLSRTEAAIYIGVGTTKFDEMIGDGRMPKPKRIDGRTVWDVRQLDIAFDNLPGEGDDRDSVWGKVAV